MHNQHIIDRLKQAGLTFAPGLQEEELTEIEQFFGFRFPAEIRSFLACAYPTASGFFPWRDRSEAGLARFRAFHEQMEDGFRFDFEENGLTCPDIDTADLSDDEHLAQILRHLHDSPRLIPFYKHRCFFDGLDNRPIISFWQPTDCIVYGANFEEYLQVEFLHKPLDDFTQPELLSGTGIWESLIG